MGSKSIKVKVCGVTRPEDAELAARLGAFAVGMVFAPGTPRALTLERAREVRRAVPPDVLAVGVFQGNAPQEVARLAGELGLDAVQLHDDEPAPAGLACWRVVAPAQPVPSGCAALLVEPRRTLEDRRAARALSDAERRAAWSAAGALKGKAPLLLVAGGISAENAGEAARLSRADALDVSSGVESAPGVKDAAKLQRLFAALRS